MGTYAGWARRVRASTLAEGFTPALQRIQHHIHHTQHLCAHVLPSVKPHLGSSKPASHALSLYCSPQEVVSYFTRYGHSAEKKLFYLVARKRECPHPLCGAGWAVHALPGSKSTLVQLGALPTGSALLPLNPELR